MTLCAPKKMPWEKFYFDEMFRTHQVGHPLFGDIHTQRAKKSWTLPLISSRHHITRGANPFFIICYAFTNYSKGSWVKQGKVFRHAEDSIGIFRSYGCTPLYEGHPHPTDLKFVKSPFKRSCVKFVSHNHKKLLCLDTWKSKREREGRKSEYEHLCR